MDTSFGTWIKRRRKALDLTQQELAKKVGCSLSAIFKIEADARRPSRQIAELLAKYLEVPDEQRDLFIHVARRGKGVHYLDSLPPLSTPRPVADPRQGSPISNQGQTDLPLPLTSLVGREHELHAVIQQIQNHACRLLTLTGPGGVGKTRLAMESARHLRETYHHGVYFVSLVGTSSSEFIIPAIADSLGFVFSGTTELKKQLFHFLNEKHILLVLDNLEHLLNGIELLDDLLEHAPYVKLLTTSREQLNLRAEWAFEVQGLPTPSKIDPDTASSNSAIALFVQRAKQVNINFSPAPADIHAIVRICQLVEGLPLGLELAATWVRTMSLIDVAREIERSIDFLTTNTRDVPKRHRSIRAVFDYSWNLLSEEEQQAMQRLSVFRGGFTRDAAEKVARARLPLLSALVEKSLVRRDGLYPGRYELHELLRQYAAARLDSNAEDEQDARRQHAGYYLSLLEEDKAMLQSRRQREALTMLTPEMDNIRTAWNEATSNGRLDLVRRAVWPLWYMYELRTYFQEAETLIKRAVNMARERLAEQGSQISTQDGRKAMATLGTLLAHQAFFCFRLGRNIESHELYQSSISLLRPLNEPTVLAYALAHYGVLRSLQGKYEDAVLNLREAILLSQEAGDRWQIGLFTTFLGMAVDDQGDYIEAHRLFTQALQICRSLGDPRLISLAAGYLGQTAYTLGRVSEVSDLLREGLQAAAETNDRFGIALAGVRMALLAQDGGDEAGARRMLTESIKHFRDAGDTWFLSHALNLEGKIALKAGMHTQAQESFMEAGKVAFSAQAFPMLLDALVGLAILDAEKNHHERALTSVIFVLASPSSTHDTKHRAAKLRAKLETQLTWQQIQTIQARAQDKTLEIFVNETLGISL